MKRAGGYRIAFKKIHPRKRIMSNYKNHIKF